MTAGPAPLHVVSSQHLPPPAASPRRGSLRPWALFTVIVIAAFFGLTYSRISLDRSGFELDRIETAITEENARVAELRAQAAELQSPDRVRSEAERMGLVYADQLLELTVAQVSPEDIDPEQRWAQLKVLLTARP